MLVHGLQAIKRFLYGPSLEERVREWRKNLREASRQLVREKRQLDKAISEARRQVKQLAAKGDVKSSRILAKELVRSGKQRDRLTVSKANLESIDMRLEQQLAMVKATGTLQKSTEITRLCNSLLKLGPIASKIKQVSYEMTAAGVMGEMLEDALNLDGDEELDSEADAEVLKIIEEITGVRKPENIPESEQDIDGSLEEHKRRLDALLTE